MATNVTVRLEDDLDGSPADATVRFGLDAADYEIDLSRQNASVFRERLAPFITHARKASTGRSTRTPRTAASRRRSSEIRAWAKREGISMSHRGRIPAIVVEQYQAAEGR